MWSAVELREIRVFLTLAEELHFGNTAERLGLTPSRVSQVLRDLELKLGAELFHRTSRRVQLTALGERLRDEVSGSYDALTATLARIEGFGRDGSDLLRLGTFSAAATGPHFLQILRTFRSRFPEREVEVQQAHRAEDVVESLLVGEIDVLATWLPIDDRDLVVGPILTEQPRVLAVSPDHALAGRPAVSVEDMADYQVIRIRGLPPSLHEAWIPSKTPSGRRIPSVDAASQTLGESVLEVGYLVASGRIVHPTVPSVEMAWGHLDIVYVPIVDLPPLRSALLWRRDAKDATLHEFIRTARELLDAATRPS